MDASRLRALRTATLAAGATSPVDFTPIISSDGAVYQLFIRDAVPFENANGLVPNDLF
jgi:hypothetical protein